MDRQTRIAFGLIFLLFILYFGYMSRFAPQREPSEVEGDSLVRSETPAETVEDGAFAPPVSEPEPAVSADASPLVPEEFDEGPRREIVVETERARYRLDSRGAVLTRIELLEFGGVDSEFVELIGAPEGEERASALSVELDGTGGRRGSADWDFQVELPGGGDSVQLKGKSEETVVFRASDGAGGQLLKSYTFSADRLDFRLEIHGEFGGSLAGTRALTVDWSHGILSTEKGRKDDLRSFNNYYLVGEDQRKRSLRNFKDSNGMPGSGDRSEEGTVQWLATKNKYFVVALVPDELQTGRAMLVGDNEDEYLGWRAEYPLRGERKVFSESFRVYAGPLVYEDLKVYGRSLEKLVDMGTLIRPISLAIKWLMDFLSRFIPNYGVIIILLSIFTKVLFYRLTHKSLKSMKDMQALQPELKAIQEKHKGNREQLSKAQMELYKKHGVNPLGGCLPLLFQMPVFFALYRVLRSAVELRGAGFMLWIDDLSNMDVIYKLPFHIPLLGGFIDDSICVLPLLMGLTMWIQQKLGGSGMGMGAESAQASQMAAMNKIMPIFMTFIFYRFPSGLVLYWLVNNILQVAQQYYIHKGLDQKPKVVPANA